MPRFLLVPGFASLVCALCACGSASAPAASAPTSGAEQPADPQPVAADADGIGAGAAMVDPVVASPDVFKVLLDGEHMRVLEATWQPGQRDNPHGHPALVAYAVTEIFGLGNEDNGDQFSIRIVKERVFLQEPVRSHSFENRGRNVAKMVIFEIKDKVSLPPPRGAVDPKVASPGVYALMDSSPDVRVLLATWQPGQTDALHGHPLLAAYAITDVEGTLRDAKGVATPFSMKAGTARFDDPIDAHSFENTGTAPAQLLLIEARQQLKVGKR